MSSIDPICSINNFGRAGGTSFAFNPEGGDETVKSTDPIDGIGRGGAHFLHPILGSGMKR